MAGAAERTSFDCHPLSSPSARSIRVRARDLGRSIAGSHNLVDDSFLQRHSTDSASPHRAAAASSQLEAAARWHAGQALAACGDGIGCSTGAPIPRLPKSARPRTSRRATSVERCASRCWRPTSTRESSRGRPIRRRCGSGSSGCRRTGVSRAQFTPERRIGRACRPDQAVADRPPPNSTCAIPVRTVRRRQAYSGGTAVLDSHGWSLEEIAGAHEAAWRRRDALSCWRWRPAEQCIGTWRRRVRTRARSPCCKAIRPNGRTGPRR
jgi:hypothetical protein